MSVVVHAGGVYLTPERFVTAPLNPVKPREIKLVTHSRFDQVLTMVVDKILETVARVHSGLTDLADNNGGCVGPGPGKVELRNGPVPDNPEESFKSVDKVKPPDIVANGDRLENVQRVVQVVNCDRVRKLYFQICVWPVRLGNTGLVYFYDHVTPVRPLSVDLHVEEFTKSWIR